MTKVSHYTTDHRKIREWVEERGGTPVRVGAHLDNDLTFLRIDFGAGARGEQAEKISWDEFFSRFERERLAFVYLDELDAAEGNSACKIVSRDHMEEAS